MTNHLRFLRVFPWPLAGVFASLTAHPFFETDVYWHLALGRAVLEHHARVVPEPMALDWAAPTCVASEWLWEVAASLLYGRPGFFAPLAALTALCAVLSAVGLVALLRASFDDERPDPGALALVSALAMSLVLSRLRLRPESAVMALLPAALLLAWRHARALREPPRAARLALALVALEVLWAQVHPTFVLLPVAWAAVVAPDVAHALRARHEPASRAALRHVGVVALGLALGLLTSAHGARVVAHWGLHVQGDAVRHISDMRAPPPEYFDPRSTTYGAFFLALLALGAAGMLAARRWFARELLLASLGAALVATAVRGVGPAAILAAPLALRGADALAALVPPTRRRFFTAGALALSVAVVALTVARTQDDEGPLGHIGPRAGSMPWGAARFLVAAAPRGAPVITSFLSGAPLGYWLHGQVRTLIDSRTPMYFSDADYGRARDLWRLPRPLELAVSRYGFSAAVVERGGPECARFAALPGWRPVVVEAVFTTFVRRGSAFDRAPSLARLAPCGAAYLGPDACGSDRGAALAAEVARLRALGSRQIAPFLGYLDAARVVRCGVEGVAVSALLARIPSEADAWAFRAQRNALLAGVLASSGDVGGAADLVDAQVRGGDLDALAAVLAPLSARDPARARSLLTDLVRALDDNAPGDARAELARLCAAAGDAACAREQGLRAAIQGSPRAGPALCWLASRHPLAHVRRDAQGWLRLLRETAPGDARLACP